ncbi:MAG: enterochelin esterase [Citrobacter freundii]|nr:enterochelin esterase [Citrobacter freundii]
MAVTTLKMGSEAWWQSKKGPEWEREDNGNYRVYITGVTDHHQNATPQSMQRIDGTNVWCWRVSLSANWRGSYCFIPTTRNDIFSSLAVGAAPDRSALREGWRQLLPQAIADPLNPQSWQGGRGHAVSALEMPEAPVQPGWDRPENPDSPAVCLQWRSARLGNTRRVWVFTTGEAQAESRPLAIMLDGQFWAQSMPVWPALTSLTHRGHLPPAVYLLIDAIDTTHRSRELPCNADFWLAVQEELLPLVKTTTAFSDDPQRTVVAGQSFGGLSSLYAGLNWPARFGCVLSQSGSYWWPGAIVEQLKTGTISAQGLRIVLEAGIREPIIYRANQALYAQLPSAPQSIFWRQVDGGHDALCWRGGLMQGLMTLWQPLTDTI